MKPQDKLSILITFVIGMFAGSYLYLAGFATTFNLPEASTKDVYTKLVIVGDSYGECKEDRTCLSFQVLEDGSYRALFDNQDGGDAVIKEGSLSSSLRRELNTVLNVNNLQANSKILSTPDCHYGTDSTNFRFKVTLDSNDYPLDSCLSSINYEGSTWKVLTKLWEYISSQ